MGSRLQEIDAAAASSALNPALAPEPPTASSSPRRRREEEEDASASDSGRPSKWRRLAQAAVSGHMEMQKGQFWFFWLGLVWPFIRPVGQVQS